MNVQALIDNFGVVAEAHEGVDQLRQLILDAAVRGHLVPQDPSEPSVAAELDAVLAERGDTLANSIRGGAGTPRRPTPLEQEGDLPAGWCWARIDDTGEYVNGLAFKNTDWRPTGTPIIRIQNLTNPGLPFNYAEGPFPDDRMARDGDILVSWSATLNAFRWTRGEAVVNQHIFKVIPDGRVVDDGFLFHLLRHSIGRLAESAAAHGLVMQHINRGPFLSAVVAVPPLREQRRIVEKLQELIAHCDDLDLKQRRRSLTRRHAHRSLVSNLAEVRTRRDIENAWSRVATAWDIVTCDTDAVRGLRQAIIDLAASGRLRQSSTADEIAEHLASQPPAASPATPPGWESRRLEDLLVDGLTNGISPPPVDSPTRVRSLKLSATTSGWFDSSKFKYVDITPEAAAQYWLKPADLLIQRSNTPDFVGMPALYEGPPATFIYPDLMMRGTLRESVNPRYVHLCLLSTPIRALLRARASGTSQSMVKLTQRAVLDCPLLVPERHEQERVMAIVDELFKIAGELERALRGRADACSKFARAVTSVHEAGSLPRSPATGSPDVSGEHLPRSAAT